MSGRRNQKAETGGLLGAQGQLELDSEFKAGLDNTCDHLSTTWRCRGRSVSKASPSKSEDLSLDPQKPCTEQDVVCAPVCPSNDNMEGEDKQTHRVHRPTGLA